MPKDMTEDIDGTGGDRNLNKDDGGGGVSDEDAEGDGDEGDEGMGTSVEEYVGDAAGSPLLIDGPL